MRNSIFILLGCLIMIGSPNVGYSSDVDENVKTAVVDIGNDVLVVENFEVPVLDFDFVLVNIESGTMSPTFAPTPFSRALEPPSDGLVLYLWDDILNRHYVVTNTPLLNKICRHSKELGSLLKHSNHSPAWVTDQTSI